MTKRDNWKAMAKVQLFAHNHMKQENFAADPYKISAGTGVGGRSKLAIYSSFSSCIIDFLMTFCDLL